MRSPTLQLPDIEPSWTPRQKQVLDLLVDGRTNGEIGEELGIGLEGVKWHVSEILSKLGVESREEAAEYWRYRNGMRMRFLRLVRGGVTAISLRWLAVGAAAVAAIAAIAIVIALLAGDGGDPEPVAPGPSATSAHTSTPGADPSPSVSPSATPTLVGAGTPTVLQPGMRGLIGYDSVAYFGISCSGCDGQGTNLYRAHYAGARLSIEELLPGTTGRPAESFYTFAADYGRGDIYVASCTQGDCGVLNIATADAENVLLHSTDGGVTWDEVGSLAPNAVLVGILADGRVLVRNAPAGNEHYFLDNDAQAVPPSPGFEGFAFVDASGSLFWRDRAGEHLYDASGDEIVLHLPAGATNPLIFDRSGSGDLWAGWNEGDARVFGRFEPGAAAGEWELVGSWTRTDGMLQVVQIMPGLSSVAAIAGYDVEPCLLLGCPEPNPRSPAVEAAIVRLDSATIHPIPELSEGLEGNQHPFLHAITSNLPYLTVDTPGDCLNVRESPSATSPVVDCVADRVLVRTNGLPEDAEGTRWQPIQLFDGREGWAAQEFLERQG